MILAAVSCRKEAAESHKEISTDAISFIVREAKPYATKSLDDTGLEAFNEPVLKNDSMEIHMYVTESDYLAGLFDPMTKGSPYTGNSIGDFSVTSFLSTDMSTPFFKDLNLDSSSGETVSTGFYWPLTTPETKINFFGYAKNTVQGTISNLTYVDKNTASFRYCLPSPDDSSAEDQPDLLFAISPEQVQSSTPVPMDFYHALSALTFSVGDVPGNLTIDKVEFTNVYSSGKCDYNLNGSALEFNWSFASGTDARTNYVQTFNKNLFDSDKNPLEEDSAINRTDQTFMMIPQTIASDTYMNVQISFDGREYDISMKLNEIITLWAPGKLYTFKISSPEEVQVEVSDNVTYENGFPVKKDLVIKNNGFATIYVRVAVAGAWVVDDTDSDLSYIVSDWKDTDGVFDWGGTAPTSTTNSKHWRLGSDGYYYYMKLVKPGEVLEKLFESYTLTVSAPVADAYLELSVLVQAVFPNDLNTAWPEMASAMIQEAAVL